MTGNRVPAAILIVIGLANIAYGLYRVIALDKSLIPIGPVGMMCVVLGAVLLSRAGKSPKGGK